MTDTIRLGSAYINLSLGEAGLSSRARRLANAAPERLESLSRANLAGLLETLRWNLVRGIQVFRITSDLIPLASHPAANWPWREALAEDFALLRLREALGAADSNSAEVPLSRSA